MLPLREYLTNGTCSLVPQGATQPGSRYTFADASPSFQSLYNALLSQSKPGQVKTWRKEYFVGGVWCTKTWGILLYANDGSITEVGDWLPSSVDCRPDTALGYKALNSEAPAGLVWCPPGGLTAAPAYAEVRVARQIRPGAAYQTFGHSAYSKAGLVELLDSYTLPNGDTYSDVAHFVMYHGVKAPNKVPARCPHCPIAADGVYYQTREGFATYAMEFWAARGVGIIRERTPFIEDGSYFGLSNCTGSIFSPGYFDSSRAPRPAAGATA
jgi:hypothetical protein